MEFCHSYLFVTFVVLTVDQIVGHDEKTLRKNLLIIIKTKEYLFGSYS